MPLIVEHIAQVVVCLRKVGVEDQSLPITPGCLIQSSLSLKRVAKIDVLLGVLRLEARGLREAGPLKFSPDVIKHFAPVAEPPLAEETHCSVPGTVNALQQPAPVRSDGQRHPDRTRQGPRQMGHRRYPP